MSENAIVVSSARSKIAIGVMVLGVGAALFLGGGSVGQCLGPLGVTVVQCAQATGVFPGPGIGIPMLALAVAIAALILVPPERPRWQTQLIAVVIGAVAGSSLYLALWPTRLEGFTSTGTYISIPRPGDGDVWIATAVTAGVLAYLLVAVGSRARR